MRPGAGHHVAKLRHQSRACLNQIATALRGAHDLSGAEETDYGRRNGQLLRTRPNSTTALAPTNPAQNTTLSSMVPMHCTMLLAMSWCTVLSMFFFASSLPTLATMRSSAVISASSATSFAYFSL